MNASYLPEILFQETIPAQNASINKQFLITIHFPRLRIVRKLHGR